MTATALVLSLLLTQNGADAKEAAPMVDEAPAAEAPAASSAEQSAQRAAEAAEKAAAAAQKAAESVERMAKALAPPEEVAAKAEEKKPDNWAGTFGMGLSYITGNTQSLTITGTLSAERKWNKWSLGIRGAGAYGLANPGANVQGSEAKTTARRANGTVRGDRSFGPVTSLFALGGVEFDHVKNVETRGFGEVGTGLTFFNVKVNDKERFFLRLDLALRAGYETRVQFFPDIVIVNPYSIVILAPRGAITLRWALNDHVRLSEELEFVPFLLAPTSGRLLINSTTKLNAKLTDNVALATSLTINHDSMPPQATPPRFGTDVALTVGIEATF